MKEIDALQSRQFISANAKLTFAFGVRLGADLTGDAVVSLEGPLGSGKTTLAAGIVRGLGIEEPVTSPSYTIITVYEGRVPVYHIDLYRIDSQVELEDLDIDDILASEGVKIIEWGEKLERFLPEQAIRISIQFKGQEERMIAISYEK